MFMVLMGMIAAISLVGRRHRHHEHHARHRHRADARDRHPPGARRTAVATSSASSWSKRSPCRSSAAPPACCSACLCPIMVTLLRLILDSAAPRLMAQLPPAVAHGRAGHRADLDSAGLRHLGARRRGLRHLPRHSRRRDGPDRGPAARVEVLCRPSFAKVDSGSFSSAMSHRSRRAKTCTRFRPP